VQREQQEQREQQVLDQQQVLLELEQQQEQELEQLPLAWLLLFYRKRLKRLQTMQRVVVTSSSVNSL
jgi:hypothetical protein